MTNIYVVMCSHEHTLHPLGTDHNSADLLWPYMFQDDMADSQTMYYQACNDLTNNCFDDKTNRPSFIIQNINSSKLQPLFTD